MQHLLKVPACNRALSNQRIRVLLQQRIHFCFETAPPPPPYTPLYWTKCWIEIPKVPRIKWNGFFHGFFIYCKILEKWIKWRKARQTQIFENFILLVPSFLFHTFAPQILGIFFRKVLVCQKLSSSLISKEVPRKIRYYYILFSCQNFIYRKIFFLCVCVTTVRFFQTHPWRINKKEIWGSSMTVAIFLFYNLYFGF